MKPYLTDRYAEAIRDAEISLAKAEKELERLKRLAKRSKKVELLWPEKVSSKNAFKTIQSAQILAAFRGRFEAWEKYSDLGQVKLSTKQLWRITQTSEVYNALEPTSKFRGYLADLQRNELIKFRKKIGKWKLTEKAIARLE